MFQILALVKYIQLLFNGCLMFILPLFAIFQMKNLLDGSNQNIFVVCSKGFIVCCFIKPFLQTQ